MRVANSTGPARAFGSGATYGRRPALKSSLIAAILIFSTIAGLGILAVLVERFDAPFVLGSMIVLAFGMSALLFPEAATMVAVFVLYANVAVVASRFHGLPKPVAAASMALFGAALFRHLILRRERIRFDTGIALIGLFVLVTGISALGAKDTGLALQRILVHVTDGVVLYLLVLNVIRSRKVFRRFVWTMVLAGAFLSTLTLAQTATGDYSQQFGGLAQRNLEGASYRATGSMGDPNRFAQILIVLLPLAFFCHRTAHSGATRVAAFVSGVAIFGGVLFTYSRGAAVTMALLAVALALLRWVKPQRLVIAGFLIVLTTPIIAPRSAERILSIANVPELLRTKRQTAADGAIRGRLTEMAAAIRVFLDYPVLGVGPAQYMPFYSVEYQDQPEFQLRDIRGQRRAHSLFAELGAELGAVGLAAFFGIIFWLTKGLWNVRRRFTHDPWLSDLATALVLMILCYLGTGIFLHLSFERYYWLMIGLGGTALWMSKHEPIEESADLLVGQ